MQVIFIIALGPILIIANLAAIIILLKKKLNTAALCVTLMFCSLILFAAVAFGCGIINHSDIIPEIFWA